MVEPLVESETRSPGGGDYVLAVQGLTKSFGPGRPLYNGINLVVHEDEIVVIIGQSGIGKSVFLKIGRAHV